MLVIIKGTKTNVPPKTAARLAAEASRRGIVMWRTKEGYSDERPSAK